MERGKTNSMPQTDSSFPILKTERLLLRQIVDSDQPKVFEGLSHPQVIQFYGVSYQSLEDTREQMNWFADLEETGKGIWWAVCDQRTHEFLGAGGFCEHAAEHKKAELGFWLLPGFWGKGFMKEAVPAICNYGFNQLGLHRIEGFVESGNANCKRAIAKLGFQHEGTMRNCEWKNDSFINVDIYSLLENEVS